VSAPKIDHLLPLTVTLVRRTPDYAQTDEYGNPTDDVVETPSAAWLEPMGSREELDDAAQVVTLRLFLPPDAPLRGWDAVRLDDGTTYELEGDAFLRVSPLKGSVPHHVEAYVRGEG
jgi:hypothetical protein